MPIPLKVKESCALPKSKLSKVLLKGAKDSKIGVFTGANAKCFIVENACNYAKKEPLSSFPNSTYSKLGNCSGES